MLNLRVDFRQYSAENLVGIGIQLSTHNTNIRKFPKFPPENGELSPAAAAWREMLADAAIPNNPSGWNVAQLFEGIEGDPLLTESDRRSLWESLEPGERDRLLVAKGQGAGK